jgi:DNA modification methylase
MRRPWFYRRYGCSRHILDDYRNVEVSNVDLFIVDPPYGKIVGDAYDQVSTDQCVNILYEILDWASVGAKMGATMYLFGGVGTYNNRPFFKFLSEFESRSNWRMHNFITWKKRRGYGTQYNYLFTREEIAFLVYAAKKPACFNVPYLDAERSDEWKKRLSKCTYKPKKNNYRRSNVFTDINELFRNQHAGMKNRVVAEKPEPLYEVLVETSCPATGFVVDPMSGSGTTAIVCGELGRRWLCVERDPGVYDIARDRLRL